MIGLYPIVRRFRRPLVVPMPPALPEPPAPVPAAENSPVADVTVGVPTAPEPLPPEPKVTHARRPSQRR